MLIQRGPLFANGNKTPERLLIVNTWDASARLLRESSDILRVSVSFLHVSYQYSW